MSATKVAGPWLAGRLSERIRFFVVLPNISGICVGQSGETQSFS